MKAFWAAALLASGLVFAANPQQVIESSEPLIGALEATPGLESSFISTYIPEYGLQITGSFSSFDFTSELDPQPGIEAMKAAVSGLSGNVAGLDSSDWISISANFINPPERYATVRIKPGQPDSLEVWVDGERQQKSAP